MCLILFAYKTHPEYKLVVAANRDEFYQRKTAPVHVWEDHPEILAGRDLEKMGTWMGISKAGRFAALTNYRNPKEAAEGKRSRGELVADALTYKGNLIEYMKNLQLNNDLYPGYNLLAGDEDNLYYYSNIGQELQKLTPGIYGVSNHLLNTEWPKVQTGKEGLTNIIHQEMKQEELAENLYRLLQHTDPAPDDRLPSTGVSLEWERMLSPLFIKSDHYGTRSSTVLFMSEREIDYRERVYNKDTFNDQHFNIRLEKVD